MSTMRKKMVMVFDANRIISEDSEGFVIPHGDHNQWRPQSLHQGSN